MGTTSNSPASDNSPRHFDVHDAYWYTPLEERQHSAVPLSGKQTTFTTNIRRASLLVDPPDRLSLYGVAFEPGFYIPTHFHEVDQFLLVIRGEFSMGSHRLRLGQGAFMPAGNPYNVTWGRAGGSFLEFRETPAYQTAFSVKDAPLIGPNAPTAIPGWSKPKDDRRKTVFFDAETCPRIECAGFGPGDQAINAPSVLTGSACYQALHMSDDNGYSMISVAIDGALDVPCHQQDSDKILYVLSGEMRLQGTSSPLRSGSGMFVSGKTPIDLSTGPAGVKYLEFRKQSRWATQWMGRA